MRMAGNHLAGQRIADIGHIKLMLLLCYLSIETDMQQHVAKFLADLMDIVPDEGIAELVSLLDGIWAQTFIGLLLVPRAIGSQRIEDIQKAPESLHFFFFCMHKPKIIGAKIVNNS